MNHAIPSYRLYGESEADRRDFWLHCEPIPERTHLHNWKIGLHRHAQFFQIFHLPTGSGEIVMQEGALAFSAPVMLFVPPGFAHGFRFSRDIDGLVLTGLADRLTPLAAADQLIADFVSDLRIVSCEEDDPASRMAATALEAINREMCKRRSGGGLALEALVTLAVISLARLDGQAAREPAEEDRAALRVERLRDLIEIHYRQRPNIGFFAAAVGLSPAHLNRLARSATGYSIQGLLDRRTMEAARRELIFTPSSVQDIAYSLGFSDPAYFNRFFRRQTGLTPGAYRERERSRLG